ncbi:peptidase MA family metallohydrolase [Dysgonomonas sp. Marseille-P4361]|uniref:peptidase MA family metallohydrolase n=1 Tax=Dysgonomonas sp. Marseille-P4361 TaxID=2161820 RepID=UPI00135A87CF|nr:peptidase MA family metallohydrolase [Dysgonomonas sp. Marseille-P4361]
MITKCDTYIEDNLKIIKETEFIDSLDIILVQDLDEMYKYTREHVAGKISLIEDNENRNMIFCLYRGKKSPLKHELMHMIAMCKWGIPEGGLPLQWLNEGLATYADPKAECDGYLFEEKYTAFLYSNKLINSTSLMTDFTYSKISYNQTAYMVEFLIQNYGVEKIKLLWQSGMGKFEEIIGLTFEELILQINNELSQKYPNPIDFNWPKFEEGCY